MKYLIYILLFIPIILNAQNPNVIQQRGVISWSTQKLLTYSEAWNNDSVGSFKANYTYDTVNSITFTKLSGSNAFDITSTGGMVYVSDSTKLPGDYIDTMAIQVADGGYSEIHYLEIIISDVDSCVFVDPDAGGGGDGSYGSPYNDWDLVTINEGYTYLQKCGTTTNDDILMDVQGTSSTKTYLGHYGKGTIPVVDRLGSTGCLFFSGTCKYAEIIEYEVTDGENGITWIVGTGHEHCKAWGCYAHDNGTVSTNNAGFYFQWNTSGSYRELNHGLYNSISNYNGNHGCKSAEDLDQNLVGITYTNIYTEGNGGQGISAGTKNTVKYHYSYKDSTFAIELQGDSSTFEDCVGLWAEEHGIGTDGGSASDRVRNRISNCVIGYAGWDGINLRVGAYDTIEDCLIYSSGQMGSSQGEDGIYIADANNCLVRRNEIRDGLGYGINFNDYNGNQNEDNLLYYNLLYGNAKKAIIANNGDSNDTIKLYNFTIYQDSIVNNGADVKIEVKNTIAQDIEADNSSNNIESSSNIYYMDASTNDFRSSGNSATVNQGVSVGLTGQTDLYGVVFPHGGTVDIGVSEYQLIRKVYIHNDKIGKRRNKIQKR